MSAAEKIAPPMTESLAWAEICRQHPSEWVCLVDVHHDPEGALRSARLIGHDRSINQALQQCSWSADHAIVCVVCVHTGRRKLRFPHIEMTDEIRDIVRARR